MTTTYRTIKVHMSGDTDYYPGLYIHHDCNGYVGEYSMSKKRMKWLDDLFASHKGNIYVNFDFSEVSICKSKEIK